MAKSARLSSSNCFIPPTIDLLVPARIVLRNIVTFVQSVVALFTIISTYQRDIEGRTSTHECITFAIPTQKAPLEVAESAIRPHTPSRSATSKLGVWSIFQCQCECDIWTLVRCEDECVEKRQKEGEYEEHVVA